MNNILSIFKIKKEERWLAAIVFLMLAILNGAVAVRYGEHFIDVTEDYDHSFIKYFCVSGFDPITYHVLSDWAPAYSTYRHPLLAIYMFIPYLINSGLMALTGYNFAFPIAVVIQMFCGLYAMLFLGRTLTEVVGTSRRHADLLALFFFSFAFIMLSTIVPDHFVISLMLLLLTLYITGKKLKDGTTIKPWHAIGLFVLTAGTSLNNGLKIWLASLFVDGKRFFRPKRLLFTAIVPAALLWGIAMWQQHALVIPADKARQEQRDKKKALQEKTRRHTVLTEKQKQRRRALAEKKRLAGPKQGEPMSKNGFLSWTDVTTSRSKTVVDNLFGESIQLHEDFLLQDEIRGNCFRPIFVPYRNWWNYTAEAIVGLLFICGAWAGRRSKFLWLVLSWFALDMLLHLGLGFGINEIYIMTAHWAFAIPIAAAYLVPKTANRGTTRSWLQYTWTTLISIATLYLIIYNGYLIIDYFVPFG